MGGEGKAPPQTLDEYIEELLKRAIQFNINYFQFWEMSVKEITLVIEAMQEKTEFEAKQKLMFDYNLAQDIAICVLNKMNGSRVPSLTEMYPGIFQELEEEEDTDNQPQAWELYKE